MRKYETPEIESIYFDLDNNIMADGYGNGEEMENPFEEFWTDAVSPQE
jgi:hypothetical protein